MDLMDHMDSEMPNSPFCPSGQSGPSNAVFLRNRNFKRNIITNFCRKPSMLPQKAGTFFICKIALIFADNTLKKEKTGVY